MTSPNGNNTFVRWDDVKLRRAYNDGEAHGIESQSYLIEELTAQRDSARDWAVALENRLAKIEDLCNDEREWNNNRNLEVACFARDIRAALTGGEGAP